jgi:penicillin-binding protein 1A
MPSIFEKILSWIRLWSARVNTFLQKVWTYAEPYLNPVADYLQRHPKVKMLLKLLAIPTIFIVIFLMVVWIEMPSKRELRNIQNQVASEIYSADSVLLGRYFIEDRTEVALNDISPAVIDALVSTEDVRFYEHKGIDFLSLGRVIIKSILMQDESAGGGSTLTQQLVKNIFPRKRYWVLSMVVNKFKEALTAQRLERLYTKDELITLYLNTVPFADNTYGIESASNRFYSVPAKDLTIDQAAVLVGMLKATHYYNPRLFPDRSTTRRNVVLQQMVKYGFLESSAADSLKQLPLSLNYNRVTHHHGLAPYFREYLKNELVEWCAKQKDALGQPYNLYTSGLKIYTTLDSKMQTYAEESMTKQMGILQQQFIDHWGKQKPWVGNERVLDEAIQRSPRYKKLLASGLTEDEILIELQKPIAMKLFTWDGVKEGMVSPIDSIIHHLQFLNAGFLAMDPTTGEVKAWVGGIDHDFFQYDHVKVSTKRQVGSIFKPIVYALAIEEGEDPCALISAKQQTYIDDEGEKWTPRNSQNDYAVDYTMRGALAYSVNTVAVKLIQKVGVDKTIALANAMGIRSEMPDVPSIALGSSSISLMEMTTAYCAFANDGVPVHPFYISKIVDGTGKVYDHFKVQDKPKRVLSSETVALTNQLLRGVVQEGTASRIRWRYGVYKTDIIGKTGTTQANADGWFMGVSPNLVVGSWVGADDARIRFRHTQLGQGSNTALPIAGYFFKMLEDDPSFSAITSAKFPTPTASQRNMLACDLYELSDTLQYQIRESLLKRDSVMLADTTATVPEETFLQVLYNRKKKIEQAQMTKDSIRMREGLQKIEFGG